MSGGVVAFRSDNDRVAGFFWRRFSIAAVTVGPDSLGEAHGDLSASAHRSLGLGRNGADLRHRFVALVGTRLRPWRWRPPLPSSRQSSGIMHFTRTEPRARSSAPEHRSATARGSRRLLVSTRSRFRANPLLHAVNWLGVGTGNVIWNNYETLHYYFPVQFQPGIDRPYPDDLEWVSIHEDPREAGGTWSRLGKDSRPARGFHRRRRRLEDRSGAGLRSPRAGLIESSAAAMCRSIRRRHP